MAPAALFSSQSPALHLLGRLSPSPISIATQHGVSNPSSIIILMNTADAHSNTRGMYKFPAPPSSPHAWEWRKNFCSNALSMVFATADVNVQEEAVEHEGFMHSDVSYTGEEASAAERSKGGVRRSSNASKGIVVKDAELVAGATFPGKVAGIQSFGAFVDFGAFTNGLVHISRLSKGYVKKVEDIVQVGQDVNVQIVDVDFNAKRVSLRLLEEEIKTQGGEKPMEKVIRRRSGHDPVVSTKLATGDIITGTVKNMIRSGVFLILPDGTDGYLPSSEIVFRGPSMNLESLFQIGQEITVRVLRVEKGRMTLTTKQEVNFDNLNEDLNKDVADRATNPFQIAFHRNESIASFLSEREKQQHAKQTE